MGTIIKPDSVEFYTIDECIDNTIQLRGADKSNTSKKRGEVAHIFDEHLPILKKLQSKLLHSSGFSLEYDETMAACLFAGVEMAFVRQPRGVVLNSVRPVDVVVVDRCIKVIEMLGIGEHRVVFMRPR